MTLMDWKSEIQAELNKALQARERGNEGQARVCARRAAGVATREYFTRLGRPVHTANAYDLLKLVSEDPSIAPNLQELAVHLTLRVDEQFKLPEGVDLLAEAQEFCRSIVSD